MWQRGSSHWKVQVFEEAFPENCSGKPTQGAANGLEKPLDESTTVSINRDLNETLTIFTTGFRTDEHSTCKHRWHSAEPI